MPSSIANSFDDSSSQESSSEEEENSASSCLSASSRSVDSISFGSSSSTVSDNNDTEIHGLFNADSGTTETFNLRRRPQKIPVLQFEQCRNGSESSANVVACKRSLHRKRLHRWPLRCCSIRSNATSDVCSGISSLIVCASFFLLIIEISLDFYRPFPPRSHLRSQASLSIKHSRKASPLSHDTGILKAAWKEVASIWDKRNPQTIERRNVEDLSPGCEPLEWQLWSFPTCNDIHSLDFAAIILEWKRIVHQQIHATRKQKDNLKEAIPASIRYLGQGLWRTAWAVPDTPRNRTNSVVIKLMRKDHAVDARNLERHRRDALVMEQLTSNPYIVSIYGFCGNTVVTEYLGSTLSTVLDASGDDNESAKIRQQHSIPPEVTRSTPFGRLKLALDGAKGIQALHEHSIVHADIQEEQFLLSSAGRLVLNDFNRCRFIAYSITKNRSFSTINGTSFSIINGKTSSSPCSFRIPSAPGTSRSPEEYAYEPLSEQIDVYSLANLLHEILTGDDPWEGFSVLEIANQVQKGVKPVAFPDVLVHPVDHILQNLTLRAYELEPAKRIKASDLVLELETAMQNLFPFEASQLGVR